MISTSSIAIATTEPLPQRLTTPHAALAPSPPTCHSERSEESAVLSLAELQIISTYIDLLLRWNARINLTAIREPEEIVTRHFGESLFAARHLFPARSAPGQAPEPAISEVGKSSTSAIDVGSGAGFPGLPIKIWAPQIHLTLIESNQKKATFLREVVRTLTLTNINVFPGRAENYPGPPADVVTLRAVEQFDTALPVATRLVAPNRSAGPPDRRIPTRPRTRSYPAVRLVAPNSNPSLVKPRPHNRHKGTMSRTHQGR